MAITIGWGSQQSWRGFESRCGDHHWSTDVGCLDETRMSTVTINVRTEQGLPSGVTGCHLKEADTLA
jgi:hypothetical protein